MLDLEGQREGAVIATLATVALIAEAIVWVRKRRPVRGSLLPLGRVALISWWGAISAGVATVVTGSALTASVSFGLLALAAAITWTERRA